ncbi:MAG: hypothetical protein ACPGLV_08240, partial [Bacteroidia bacterium]
MYFWFLKIHIKRWYRFADELGPIRAIIVLILLIAVGKYAVEQFIAGVNYWAFLPLLVAQAIQFQRKDFNFLKLAHIHKYWPYAFIYFFMCAITFIAFGFNSLWYQLLLSVLICIALPAVNIKGTSIDPLFVNFGNFLKPTSFEWRTGLRQYGLAVVLLLLAGLGLSYFKGGSPEFKGNYSNDKKTGKWKQFYD